MAFDADLELLPLELDDEISGLEVSGDSDVDVEVSDGLVPFVGQRCLFLGFLGAGSSFLLGGEIYNNMVC